MVAGFGYLRVRYSTKRLIQLTYELYERNFTLLGRHKSPTVGRDHLQTVARILDMPNPAVANHPQAWRTGRTRGGNAERHRRDERPHCRVSA